MKTRILLIGCGYTTVWCYKYMMRHMGSKIKNGEVEIILLSDTAYHSFHGFTGEFLSGYIPLRFRNTPYQEIMPHVKYIKGKVTGINSRDNEVEYIDGLSRAKETLRYDHVVVGIGSRDNHSSITGARQFGLSVKKQGGLDETRTRIIESLQKAQATSLDSERQKFLTFTVIGGGFTGAEIAGNLSEYLQTLKPYFPILKEHNPHIYLIHPGEKPLQQIENRKLLRKYAIRVLKKKGVEILPNNRLEEITEDGLKLSSGQFIPTIVPICSTGQRVQGMAGDINTEINIGNRILTDDFLRAKGYDNIWVGGDSAIVRRPFSINDCRSDALWAIKHGTRIGKNLARLIKGKDPVKFYYPGLGQTASFGKNQAILELYGIPIVGPMAWSNRIGFFLYFMPSKKRAIQVLKSLYRDPRELLPQGHPVEEERAFIPVMESISANG